MNNFFNRYIIGAYVTVIVSILGFFVDVSFINVNYLSDAIFYSITGVAGLYTVIVSIFSKRSRNIFNAEISDKDNDVTLSRSNVGHQTTVERQINTTNTVVLQFKDLQITMSL